MLPSVSSSGCFWPLPDPEPRAPPGTTFPHPTPPPQFLMTWLSDRPFSALRGLAAALPLCLALSRLSS